ncbi:MAG: M16 family metallopeptidase, partial [Candidatus Dormibacteria bacterium]
MARALEWTQSELEGGVRLLVAPMPGRQSVAATVLVGVGSRWESRNQAGISHFLEHIVFKGTERFPNSRAVSQSIEGIGGSLNASTDKEATVFWARVPREHTERALEVLFDLAFAPRIEAGDVGRERQVVLEELSMYLDQPSDLAQMLFDSLIWGSHPLARDPAGTRRSLAGIGAEELHAYRRGHYLAPRVVIALAGGVEPGPAQAAVARRLGLQAPGAGPAQQPDDGGVPAPLVPEALARARRRRGEQVHLLLGVRCASYLDPERWTLDVLNTVLGEGMSSRLFLELRERRGLAYDVHSYAARHHDSGAFGIYLATQPGREQEAVTAALAQVRRLVERPIGPSELRR